MTTTARARQFLLGLLLLGCAMGVGAASAQDAAAGALRLLSFEVSYGGKVYDAAANQTTFSYIVTGVDQRPDLSHFDVGIPVCAPALLIAGYSPTDAVSFGIDPTTGIDGVKWDLPLRTSESRTYSLTFIGNVSEGPVQLAIKADSFEIGGLPGPSCTIASIDVDKFLSVDGGVTWDDADDAPGLQVERGGQVQFRFVVTNVGNVELSEIALRDDRYDLSACNLPARLSPNAFAECTIGPLDAEEGQHINTATASGVYLDETVVSTDSVYYYSGDLPQISLEKLISRNEGKDWRDNVRVRAGRQISFKFIIANIGNVPLTDLVLADDSFDASGCALPATLAPEASFECVIGPFAAGEDDLVNLATITARYEDQTVTAEDTASYQLVTEDDDESGTIIIVEGPIERIDGNIIVIFDLDIEIDPDDPILRTIRIGDTIRIEGDWRPRGDRLVIIAITIIIIDVDIIIVGPPGAPIIVPPGCKITGLGKKTPRLKCSKKSKKSKRT